MAQNNQTDNQTLLLALSHPLRRRILRLMEDGLERSPGELADAFGGELTNVSYHVRVLHVCRVLTDTQEVQVRGVTRHVYRRELTTKWALDLLAEEQ